MSWTLFKSPLLQWDVLPSFLVGETVFVGLAIALLAHAIKSGRATLLLWFGALIAGTVNDLVFMALPVVDNFWHAQATVMLTPRLPLYIPCVYVCFMYLPTVAARRLGLPLFSTAALAGLLAVLFYAPFDITGAKLLWWTWHDTDLPIAARILGAPASSTLWVLTFSGSYALLCGWVLHRHPDGVGWRAIGLALGAAPLPIVLVMVAQITLLQQLDGGAPGYAALGVGVMLYFLVALWGARRANPSARSRWDRIAAIGALVHFGSLTVSMAAFDPETHRSTGVHQEVGECYVEATDITGLTRHRYLCANDFDEDYAFDCAGGPPAEGTRWYTVCGRAHTRFGAWMGAVGGLGVLGSSVFVALFVAAPRPSLPERSGP